MARVLIVDPQAAIADLVVPSARQLGLGADVTVADTLSPGRAAGHYEIVVAGPGLDTQAGLRDLAILQEADPTISIVLAFDRRPRVSLDAVIRAGAVDLLTPDSTPTSVMASLQRALHIAEGRKAQASQTPTRGTVITVASASGGCGKTF